MKKVSILFLIDNLSLLGGAEQNLISVVKGLNSEKYRPFICCLQGGMVFEELKKSGFNIINFDIEQRE